MEVRRFDSVPRFLAVAGDYLAVREAEHNLVFGICSTLQVDPSMSSGPPYLAAVLANGRVVAAALRTPPRQLVLSESDHPDAIAALIDDLVGETVPGVLGPARLAAEFAGAWERRLGRPARLLRGERIFRLSSVVMPPPVPGVMRAATRADRPLVLDWLTEFQREALPEEELTDAGPATDRWLAGTGRTLCLWLDGDRPVSLAGVGSPTPNGLRVGPVYTPPGERGRGYASNLVARASQAALDAGARFLFLFTDLANPTANHIYQAIGYEPVSDVDQYAFD
jgi:uncharacterized protein